MTASVNPDDVDINAKTKEKDEALYLKSMDSFMDELIGIPDDFSIKYSNKFSSVFAFDFIIS
jgi:hypothetical protein